MLKHGILLLGLGFWGSKWLDLIQSTECCQLSGVAGSPSEIQKVCSENGICPDIAFTDFREAIAKTDAEIAVVVIPGVLHMEADILAMQKGMNIITEKPLASNLDEAKKLLACKKKHPEIIFMASQNYRWRPYNQTLKKALKDGMIGKPEAINYEFRQQEDLQGYRAGLACPLLDDVCIHHFDLIRFLTDSDGDEVYCRTWRPGWSAFEGKPNVEAVVKMENGVYVSYNGTWAARGRESLWDGNLAITGDKGSLTLSVDGKVRFYPFNKAESVILDTKEQSGIEIPTINMRYTETEYALHLMIDCLEKQTVPETTLEDNYKSYLMVETAKVSAATGKTEKCIYQD